MEQSTNPDGLSRGDKSRAAILQAARTLFAGRGYRGTSLASIAQLAGLSEPGLLHHFPAKEKLLLAVLAERDEEDGRLSSAHLKKKGADILPALGTLVEHNQTTPEIIRLHSVLLGEGVSSAHPAHSYFVERYEKIRARILRNLQLAEESGELQPGTDLEAVAALVVAVLDGLQFQWLLDDSIDMAHCYQVLTELLLRPAATTTDKPTAPSEQP